MRLFKSLFHISFWVNDLDRTLDFYCNKLGFERMFTVNIKDTDEPWLTYLRIVPGQYLEIFPISMNNPYIKLKEAKQYIDSTFFHFALEVDSLEETTKELAKKGVTVYYDPVEKKPLPLVPFDYHHGDDACKIGWIIDPDGNCIELMEQPGGTLQQKFEEEHPMK